MLRRLSVRVAFVGRWSGCACLAWSSMGIVLPAAAQVPVPFVDVSRPAGILPFQMSPGQGGGIAAADYDNDGFIDVFAPNDLGADLLYHNFGDGTFEEVCVETGITNTDPNKVPLWFDYDGDGWLDLLVTGGDSYTEQKFVERELRLYRQHKPGQFIEVTESSGLSAPGILGTSAHVGGVCAGDINNDGDLDLIVTVWFGPIYLYLNNGDGTFTDITATSGIGGISYYWQPVMYDFNQDGWQDIYLAVDFGPNRLWINQHDNTFVNETAAAGLGASYNEMGIAFGDYDNDGDLDIFITNIFDYLGLGEHNILYKNNSVGGTMSFQDVGVQAKVHNAGWAWGCTFIDVDNDGRQDLAATNGFVSAPHLTDPSKFFRNVGGSPVTFSNVSGAIDFDDTFWSSGLVAADFDRDGDQDMMQACNVGGPLRLLDNKWGVPGTTNQHLVIQPRMREGGNRFAIGAEVKMEAVGGLKQARLITAGNSYFSQEPAEAFFGLGGVPGSDPHVPYTHANVLVLYPNGTRMAFVNLPGNQIIEVVLGDLNASGVINGLDLALLLGNWGPCRGGTIYCPGDFNGDNAVNGLDLALLLGEWG